MATNGDFYESMRDNFFSKTQAPPAGEIDNAPYQAIAQQYLQKHSEPSPPFNPNNSAALKLPLSTLLTLWSAKCGDTWVNEKWPHEQEDAEFWKYAHMRLRTNALLETFKCEGKEWYRLKEGA